MPAWYLLRLDPWQLSLKYSTSSTQNQPLSCRVTWYSCWLEHGRPFARSRVRVHPWVTVFSFLVLFLTFLSMTLTRLRSDCQVWSMLTTEPAPHASCSPHPPNYRPDIKAIALWIWFIERPELHSGLFPCLWDLVPKFVTFTRQLAT